ncbi:MAG: type II toxin-antitoxin system RelB/DinJ family antitoxin [Gammaproteobacteria bacterium]|nr:type II toxin-antitoxin system RelB/DinJ family antitoxin [Gammaproteobacteria bacterium]
MATTMLHVRVDEETKDRASAALDAMGLSVSEAVRVFLHRVAAEQAIPFPLEVPNVVTRAAMEEARSKSRPRFATGDALFDGLTNKRK